MREGAYGVREMGNVSRSLLWAWRLVSWEHVGHCGTHLRVPQRRGSWGVYATCCCSLGVNVSSLAPAWWVGNKHGHVALSALRKRGTAVDRRRAVSQVQQFLPGVSTIPDMWFPGKNCLFLALCSLGFFSPSQTTGYSHSNPPPYGLGF